MFQITNINYKDGRLLIYICVCMICMYVMYVHYIQVCTYDTYIHTVLGDSIPQVALEFDPNFSHPMIQDLI